MISEIVSFTHAPVRQDPRPAGRLMHEHPARPGVDGSRHARQCAHDRLHRDRAAVLVQGDPRARQGDARRSASPWPWRRGSSPGYAPLDTGGFFGALVLELLVGATLGFLVFLVFSAVQSAGNLIDMFGGFQMAQGFDPGSQINGAQFSRLFQMTALALLFTSGGYQLIIGGLVRSLRRAAARRGHRPRRPGATDGHRRLPDVPRRGADRRPADRRALSRRCGLGLLTRVAPALNAFAMGFPLKILITLTLGGLVIAALPDVVGSLTDDAVRMMSGVK